MKLAMFFAATGISVQALAGIRVGAYEMKSVPHAEIDQHLVIGSAATGTPENLRGLWWMDGNPLPDEVISFASTRFDQILMNGDVVGYKATIPVYDEGIWSWHDSIPGEAAYRFVNYKRAVYEAYFNADFTHGEIIPVVRPLILFPDIEIPQSFLVNFSMTRVNSDEWRRDSVVLGVPSSYSFRRIVDGQGRHLPAWDRYITTLAARGPVNALLPVCVRDRGDQLPTACVDP